MICKGRRCMFLFAVYMAIYLLIYGFLLLRLAPLWDEVYDYCGEGMDSYVIFRRWGQFLYRIVFAEGLQPYIAGIVAGIYICLAILLQTAYFRFFQPVARAGVRRGLPLFHSLGISGDIFRTM